MEKEEKVAAEAAAAEARRRLVIGVGFWVQGFRLFPWLGVNFFLKDGMGVAASSLQILQASANLPMVAKPLLGLLSDAVPIRGHRRLPYVAIGGTPTPPFPFTNLLLHFLPRSQTHLCPRTPLEVVLCCRPLKFCGFAKRHYNSVTICCKTLDHL